MRKQRYQQQLNTQTPITLPIGLIGFMVFNWFLSLIHLPGTFFGLIIFLALTAFYQKLPKLQLKIVQPLIKKIVAYTLLFIGLGLIWLQLDIPSLIALTALLSILSGAKACELTSIRDIKFIWLLLAVQLAINILLLEQYQILTAVIGLTLLLLTANSFSSLSEHRHNCANIRTNKQANTRTNGTQLLSALKQLNLPMLLSLPLAIILFITLPRINLPMQELGLAMGLPITVEVDKSQADKGLGKELSFNDIGSQGRSDARVLLASLPTDFKQSAETPLYWRGPVYWRYQQVQDENKNITEKWLLRKDFSTRSKRQYNGFGSNQAVAAMAKERSNTIDYSVILMPHGEYWLYALDLPQTLTGESYLSQDYQLLSIRKVNTMWRYKIQSSLTYQISEQEPEAQRKLGLQYPNINPKIKALGQKWAQTFAGSQFPDHAIIAQAKTFFTQGKYLYANSTHQYQGENQLDQFMFTRKVGYSQHYASALTLLLRAANIPARLVAGYRGAEQVALTNMYTVNDHHAHAWVEAYLTNENGNASWQRIDPSLWLADLFSTGKTNPETSLPEEQNTDSKINKNVSNNQLNDISNSADKNKAKAINGFSVLDQLKQWTLDFDAIKQNTLAKKLGIETLRWWHLLVTAFVALVVIFTLYYVVIKILNKSPAPKRHVLIYRKVCNKLAKKGLTKLPYEGAQCYLTRCMNANIPTIEANHLAKIQSTYLQLAYSKITTDEYQHALQVLKQQVAKL